MDRARVNAIANRAASVLLFVQLGFGFYLHV
jgi:hypothetical protein